MTAVGSNEDISDVGSPPASRRMGHVAILLFVGGMWGLQPALIKLSNRTGLAEIETLALVMVITATLLGAWLAARGRLVRPTGPLLVFMAISGFAEYAAPLLAAFVVAAHIDAGLLTLIMATTPIFTVALAAAVGSEPLTRDRLIACGIGMLAIVLIVVPQDALPSPEMLPWCLAAFLVPMFYASGSVYVSRAWPPDLDAVQVAFGGSLAASLMLLPFWARPLIAGAYAGLDLASGLVLLALVASLVVEMVLYFWLLRNAGPVFTSFSSFVMIASGFIAGMVVFGERPSPWVWASVGLLAIALLLAIRTPHAEARSGAERMKAA
ncbi:MAG: DMT family transporter [Hyphomicrobium sp.]